MSNKLPKDIAESIRTKIYSRADEFGYAGRSRTENSQFMDDLIDDPTIGGVLKSYYPSERIRTYIKDAVLNSYTKSRNRALLAIQDLTLVLHSVFGVESSEIQKLTNDTLLYGTDDDTLIIVSKGTYVKWETALRRALETIAKSPMLREREKQPLICLLLAISNGEATEADKDFIKRELSVIGVGVYFC